MSVTRRYIRVTSLTSWLPGSSNYTNTTAMIGEANLLDSGDTPISRASWTVSADASDPDFATTPDLAVDSDTVTGWMSPFFSTNPPHPHTFTIDQGSAVQVYKFRLTNRLNVDGAIGGYQIHSSPDGAVWTLCGSGDFNTGTPGSGSSYDTAELFESAVASPVIGRRIYLLP
jgi:hypothetical protein